MIVFGKKMKKMRKAAAKRPSTKHDHLSVSADKNEENKLQLRDHPQNTGTL